MTLLNELGQFNQNFYLKIRRNYRKTSNMSDATMSQ